MVSRIVQKLFEADFFFINIYSIKFIKKHLNELSWSSTVVVVFYIHLMGKNVTPKYWLVIVTHQLEWGRWAAVWAGQYESQPSFRRWVSCAGTRTTAESPETWEREEARQRKGGGAGISLAQGNAGGAREGDTDPSTHPLIRLSVCVHNSLYHHSMLLSKLLDLACLQISIRFPFQWNKWTADQVCDGFLKQLLIRMN